MPIIDEANIETYTTNSIYIKEAIVGSVIYRVDLWPNLIQMYDMSNQKFNCFGGVCSSTKSNVMTSSTNQADGEGISQEGLGGAGAPTPPLEMSTTTIHTMFVTTEQLPSTRSNSGLTTEQLPATRPNSESFFLTSKDLIKPSHSSVLKNPYVYKISLICTVIIIVVLIIAMIIVCKHVKRRNYQLAREMVDM